MAGWCWCRPTFRSNEPTTRRRSGRTRKGTPADRASRASALCGAHLEPVIAAQAVDQRRDDPADDEHPDDHIADHAEIVVQRADIPPENPLQSELPGQQS